MYRSKMFVTILVIASIAGLFHEISSTQVIERRNFRIINGNDVAINEIPYQVSLQSKKTGYHVCGGSIITEDYVLTAAHCLFSKRPVYSYNAKDLRISAGVVDLWYPVALHDVSRTIIHENYKPMDWQNDIALLEVDKPFQFNTNNLAPAKLPQFDEQYDDDTKAIVSGFGKTESVDQSPKLLRANVLLVNHTQCKAAYVEWPKYPVRMTNICAKGVNGKQGWCNGDSGGPLSIDGTVIGLVSWSMNGGCYQNGQVQVYTRVSSYTKWISKNIDKKLSCSFGSYNRHLFRYDV